MPWYETLDRGQALLATLGFVLVLAAAALLTYRVWPFFFEEPVPPFRRISRERWVLFAASLVAVAVVSDLPYVSYSVSSRNRVLGFPLPTFLGPIPGINTWPRVPLTSLERDLRTFLDTPGHASLTEIFNTLFALLLQHFLVRWALRQFAAGRQPAGAAPARDRFGPFLLAATRVLLVLYCPILGRLPSVWLHYYDSGGPFFALEMSAFAGLPGLAMLGSWCFAGLWIFGVPSVQRRPSSWAILLVLATLGFPASWVIFLG